MTWAEFDKLESRGFEYRPPGGVRAGSVKYTLQEKEDLVDLIYKRPFAPMGDIVSDWNKAHGKEMSSAYAYEIFNRLGGKRFAQLQVSVSGPEHKRARKRLFKRVMRRPRILKRALMTDESSFELRFRLVRRNRKTPARHSKDPVRFSHSCGRSVSVMVWGGVCVGYGRTRLVIIDPGSKVTASRYSMILQHHVEPFCAGHPNVLFQHDGAKVHHAHWLQPYCRSSLNYFGEWPAYSADFSIIERVWNRMKARVRRLRLRTVPQLLERLPMLWWQETTRTKLRQDLRACLRNMARSAAVGFGVCY